MRTSKFVVGAAMAAGALLASASANAAVIIPSLTMSGDTLTGTFGDSFTAAHSLTSFTDTIAFTLSKAGSYSGSVSASSIGSNVIQLTSVVLSSGAFTDSYNLTTSPSTYFANLAPTTLAAGSYVITVQGMEKNTVSYTGNFTFLAAPEPAAWAMMITGLGLLGLAARRRRDLTGLAA